MDAFQGETLSVLSRLLSDMDKSLEKVTSREKYIQDQFEAPTASFKNIQGKMSEMKQGFQGAQSRVTELSMELLRVSEELERVKVGSLFTQTI